VETNKLLSERFQINQSVAVTCGKPSGNSSVLLNCSSGIHVRPAPYYIRRVRAGTHTPVARVLKDSGVPWFPETGQDVSTPSVVVFEFPVKSPGGAIHAADVTAENQFDFWLDMKMHYTEHSVSCSVYVDDDEWVSLGALIYRNWDKISGLSFFPKTSHIYPLAPNEPITKEEYERRLSAFPVLDWTKLVEYEKRDETTIAQEYSCISGACEL
jgi:ribonucleoside-diphosphate reductase alpha chain